ncbi:protein kinase domain-containing protein [Amycolatopsis keratiniphila]|uniref:non-specific serine/threonine protein kinase n=1 Tax=Amycolatopsis keratiniphila subsp. keratiniphila TaxID=227715 RepID=A0A1W2M066_9PSEU|nr:protein kinase [Amycolatopsis keratiniphila]ONF73032.1 serine/threonine protein kinase [Amycolatopsis keratiniphila subsp. keratiniphila]
MNRDAVIAGRYRLEREVGRGSMGVVWRARDERLDRTVALKQLLPDTSPDGAPFRSIVRAMREARVAARLKHPHAVTVYDVVEQDGTPFLVMEYLPSRPLTDLLADDGLLPAGRVAELGARIASALAAAHEDGILHRDVTPNNILITGDGNAKIADFGLSHATGEGTMTGGGLVVGTPAYLSPEVADGEEPGYPSDVFSLGSTLYTVLEGAPPFGTDANQIALLKRVARGEIVTPRTTGPLTDVLLRMLRRDPAERPDMAEAGRMLAAVADGRPAILAGTKRLPAPARRSRLPIAIAGGVVVAGGVLAGILLFDGDAPDAVAPVAVPSPSAAKPVCEARYEIANRWPGGSEIRVSVRNAQDTRLTGWEVSWTLPPGTRIANLWNGSLAQDGDRVRVSEVDWNAVLPAGGTTTFGFIATTEDDGGDTPVAVCRSS